MYVCVCAYKVKCRRARRDRGETRLLAELCVGRRGYKLLLKLLHESDGQGRGTRDSRGPESHGLLDGRSMRSNAIPGATYYARKEASRALARAVPRILIARLIVRCVEQTRYENPLATTSAEYDAIILT